MQLSHLLFTLLLSCAVSAHNFITYPPPFRGESNPYNVGLRDYNIMAPLLGDGSDFPCKGYHLLPKPATKPAASWEAGSLHNFTINAVGAIHNGGSCQASISEDNGATWKVIHSYHGNCPVAGGSFFFTVPTETKAGDVLFAWTWFNKSGNREMYMNCAAVTITGAGGSGLSAYPDMFVACVGAKGNGCKVEEGYDVVFPNPGAFVDIATTQEYAPKVPNGPGCPGVGGGTGVITPPAVPGTSVKTGLPTVVTDTPAAAEGCMCSCGGANGYVVNIMPAMMANDSSAAAPTSAVVDTYARRARRHF